MGDTVNQLFFTGDQGINVIRHLVERDTQTFETGAIIEVQAFSQVTLAKALRGGFEPEHFLPVRAHPDKHRKGERKGNERH
ncbi:hypothetical protein NGUA41_04667 [Salmonella enterica]|nr:hypothetical protein NGUA41_04667 [Salmonella enterica]